MVSVCSESLRQHIFRVSYVSMMDQFKRVQNLLSRKKAEPARYSSYKYKPNRASGTKRRKRLYLIGILLLIFSSVIGILYRLPVSFQDAAGIITLSVARLLELEHEEIAENNTGVQQNKPVLRGTIYDRNMEE
ncbi:MAG: hypothetical protein D3924_11150, partial [Candidatus Electrothrix sp. AR4]|nr:hypothetical protein [Candidatus Electrothrix sp. AR4]